MTHRERLQILTIFTAIATIVLIDLGIDALEGAKSLHLLTEGIIGLIALGGIFLIMRESITLKRSLEEQKKSSAILAAEAQQWKSRSKKYLEGLGNAIEEQLDHWKLTPSEKEVAFLLLKGLGLKEVAEIRKTTEKTARAQAISIYAKAGVTGRSELSAFFLEDLLTPRESSASSPE